MKGKHLYYRCTSRVKSFPLLSLCEEKAVNARVADELVWNKTVELMSSPTLLRKQVERWMNSRNKEKVSTINIQETEKEVLKLKTQEDRYAKAYGAGVITIEQFKEYTLPLKGKVDVLHKQINTARAESNQNKGAILPLPSEVEVFVEKAQKTLLDLKFEAKQAIVRRILDKVVGTQTQLHVSGFIPITENINVFTFDRNCWSPQRRKVHSFQRSHQKERACCKLSFRNYRSFGRSCCCTRRTPREAWCL